MKIYIKVLLLLAGVIGIAGWMSPPPTPQYLPLTAWAQPAARFGIKCDGTTDDTVAIRNAYASMGSGGGGVIFPEGTCKITGMIDIASTVSGTVQNFRAMIGQGKKTVINCVPATTITACIRDMNGAHSVIENMQILNSNHNPTYTLMLTVQGATNEENVRLNNLYVTGGQYGIALGPDTTGDLSHLTLTNVTVAGSALADLVVGSGSQGNVLDINCYGCTFDGSGGYGVLLQGGGFSMYGGGFDSNTAADIKLKQPSTQPLVFDGIRSENSPALLEETQGGTYAIGNFSLRSVDWANVVGGISTCVVKVTSSLAVSITDSKFYSTDTTPVAVCAQHTTGNPVILAMRNVGSSSDNGPTSSWTKMLSTLATQQGTQLESTGDYYINPSTFAQGPGSGMSFHTGMPIYAGPLSSDQNGDLATIGSVAAGGSISAPIGGIGSTSNSVLYSQFDAGHVGVGLDWQSGFAADLSCTAAAATSPFTGLTDAETCTTSNPITTEALQLQNGTTTAGTAYAVSAYLRGHTGGENLELGMTSATANRSGGLSLTTSWKRYCFTSVAASSGGTAMIIQSNTPGAVFDVWGAQLEVGSLACDIYVRSQGSTVSATQGAWLGGRSIVAVPSVAVAVPSFAVPATTCYGSTGSTTPATFAMSGLAVGMKVTAGDSANPSAVTGWGSTGGLAIRAWASAANQGSYVICNPTAGSITGGAITFVMGAQ